jgi:hypothetical protein
MNTKSNPTYINVRGPNGAGKTTLLRCLARSPECRVVPVYQPLWLESDAKVKPERIGTPKGRPIPATITPDGWAILGDYTPAASGTTAGCDRISRQADIKQALVNAHRLEGVRGVLFEGVIVATIFGPWMDWARENDGMTWAFLDTPLDVCLKRIQDRNGGQPIKEDLVASKFKTIRGVRTKAQAAGEHVVDLHWETALKDIKSILGAIA